MKKKLYLSFGLIAISLCGPLRSAYDEISNPFTIQHSVGIGTETPQTKLHVNGPIMTQNGYLYFGTGQQRLYGNNASILDYHSNHSSAVHFRLRDNTVSPGPSVHGSVFGQVDGDQFGLLDKNLKWIFRARPDISKTEIMVDGTEIITAKKDSVNGNKVGIGTVNPEETLHVAGTAKFEGEVTIASIPAQGDVLMGEFTN